MRTYVSDPVWRRLDPGAGKLTRRSTIRLWIAVGVGLALLLAGNTLWRAGLVVPRLAWPVGLQAWEENPQGVRVKVQSENTGWWPVTVRSIGRSGAGLELLGVEGAFETRGPSPFPVYLEPGERVEATLVYRVTDCEGYLREPWLVTAEVDRPWGAMTVEVAEEPNRFPWHADIVQTWCRPGGPGGR